MRNFIETYFWFPEFFFFSDHLCVRETFLVGLKFISIFYEKNCGFFGNFDLLNYFNLLLFAKIETRRHFLERLK